MYNDVLTNALFQVCQAKCMKCGAFGHMNIDKRCFLEFNEIMSDNNDRWEMIIETCRCPLYGKAHDSDAPLASRDSDKLITEMRQVCSLPMFLGDEDFSFANVSGR